MSALSLLLFMCILSKLLLYIPQEQSLTVSIISWTWKSFTVHGTFSFKIFKKWLLWWTKVQERQSYSIYSLKRISSQPPCIWLQYQRHSFVRFTLTPVCQCIEHVYSIEYISIYWKSKGSAFFFLFFFYRMCGVSWSSCSR